MTMHPSRRAFLMKVAQTAAYVPPTLVALAAPDPLAAQVTGKGKDMGGGGGGGGGGGKGGGGKGANLTLPSPNQSLPTAPWEKGPPGGE